jgi:hypothetical protein
MLEEKEIWRTISELTTTLIIYICFDLLKIVAPL